MNGLCTSDALDHLQSLAWKTYDVMMLFSSETTTYEKMSKVRVSLWNIKNDLKAAGNCDSDLSVQSRDCVSLVKDMIGTFEPLHFRATSFQDIVTFAKFLTSLVGFLNSQADDTVTKLFEMRIQKLILCYNRLKLKGKINFAQQ